MNPLFSRRHFGRTALQLAALTLTLSGTQLAHAQNVSFAGKTIEWVIPFGVGGGSDVWARFNAPFLTKYLPGNPNVVVKNVPGGGSITGTNQFAANAKPDGLTVLGTSGSTQFPYLLGDARVRYDYKNWEVVMASPTGGVAYLSSKYGVKSVSELNKVKGQKLVYGSQGATSLDLVPLLGFRMLGLDVQHVFGMKSRGEGRLAFERGEATIDYQTSSAYIKSSIPLVKEGKAVPLFSWGVTDNKGNLIRDLYQRTEGVSQLVGIELARRVDGTEVYGVTTPLITLADGGKMGKTAAGAVWLDPEKTSPYKFYQFFVNTEDAKVGEYLEEALC